MSDDRYLEPLSRAFMKEVHAPYPRCSQPGVVVSSRLKWFVCGPTVTTMQCNNCSWLVDFGRYKVYTRWVIEDTIYS